MLPHQHPVTFGSPAETKAEMESPTSLLSETPELMESRWKVGQY